jgi:hypothetical protein
MKNNFFISVICCFALIITACSNESISSESVESQDEITLRNSRAGAIQISGKGLYADNTECDYVGEDADFALILTGDLEGCLFAFVDEYECSPSGTYREVGREYFVGTYKGEAGSFWTNYRFTSKFEGCSEDGFFLGAEIFGRCQHPIQAGSGDGVFEGVTGRLDFKDNVETGEFPYSGHLKF